MGRYRELLPLYNIAIFVPVGIKSTVSVEPSDSWRYLILAESQINLKKLPTRRPHRTVLAVGCSEHRKELADIP